MKLTDGERRQIKKEGAIKVFSNENFCVVIPKTHMAAKVYSYGTMWCTTDENSFNSYDFPLFIIIDKKKTNEDGRQKKYQLHFETGGFKNETCEDLDFSKFISDAPILKDLFVNLINENVYKQYRDVEVFLNMDLMNVKEILTIPQCDF